MPFHLPTSVKAELWADDPWDLLSLWGFGATLSRTLGLLSALYLVVLIVLGNLVRLWGCGAWVIMTLKTQLLL